jgi:hypothetical protein
LLLRYLKKIFYNSVAELRFFTKVRRFNTWKRGCVWLIDNESVADLSHFRA